MASSPSPTLLFSFNGSASDSVTGLSPTATVGSPTYVPGLYNQAINFNNSPGGSPSQYIQYSTSLSSVNLTISLWIKCTSFPSGSNPGTFLYFSDSSTTNYSFGTNTTSGVFILGTSGTTTTKTGPAVSAQTWFHQALVVTSTNYSYYQNGQLISTTSSPPNVTLTNMTLGSGNGSSAAQGSVQDIRVYNTALNAQQVLGIYYSQGIPPYVNFVKSSLYPVMLFTLQNTLTDSINGFSPTTGYNNVSFQIRGTSFDGTVNSWLTYGSTITLLKSGTSIACWINASTLSPAASYICQWGTSGAFFNLMVNQSNFLTSITVNGVTRLLYSATVPTTGSWYHVAAVYYPNVLNIYINGTFEDSINNLPTNTTNFTSTTVFIAGININQASHFNGTISNLGIYNTALTADQVQTIYQSTNTLVNVKVNQRSSIIFSVPFNNNSPNDTSSPVNSNGFPVYDTNGLSLYNNGLILQNNILVNPPSSNTLQYNISGVTGNITITGWFKPLTVGSASTQVYLAWKDNFNGMSSSYYAFQNVTDSTLNLYTAPSAGSPLTLVGQITSSITAGTWYHYAICSRGSSYTIYINGVPTTLTTTNSVDGIRTFSFGTLGTSSTDNSFLSSMEAGPIRIYNETLQASMIKYLYNSKGFNVSTI